MKTNCTTRLDRIDIADELSKMPKLVDGDRATACPKCHASWVGAEIQSQYRHFYGANTTHYSRLIGVEISGYYDGIAYWRCPDCGTTFRRF